MFRLLCAASLTASLLACGAAARAVVFADVGGAVAVAECGGCGSAVVVDEATGRRGPCGCGSRHHPDARPESLLASR